MMLLVCRIFWKIFTAALSRTQPYILSNHERAVRQTDTQGAEKTSFPERRLVKIRLFRAEGAGEDSLAKEYP